MTADDREFELPDPVEEQAPGSAPAPSRGRGGPGDLAGDGIVAEDRGIEDPLGAGRPPEGE